MTLQPLPGAKPFPPELARRLLAALAAKGKDDVARTHHRNPDGSPRYTNRLILETSPYLLQHAHNPVNWYPWGEEAFARAAAEQKPVLLSVGYSTCHWCHVMEAESFEDEEIAAFLNEHFIAIKVDREERPDVDGVYMSFVQLTTGSGGWPMTVFLTPERQPFFGGTYFPPRDGVRGARVGFLTLLHRIHEAYEKDREGVVAQAKKIAEELQKYHGRGGGKELPGADLLEEAQAAFSRAFDDAYGGFGSAPKFPRSMTLDFLLRHHRRTENRRSLEMVTKTLDAMARGGIYDQIGGGFHRYATDRRWLVPHFEKMLYDNALLAVTYLEAYQATGQEAFAQIARETLDYIDREMSAPEGGFFSATDADSEGEEGKFFVWTPDEIDALLGPEEGRIVKTYYDVTPQGNFEGKNILHRPLPDEAVAG
ncbi:MAG: thioredoxin domain-containing protein, partial [Deltaproteobacteria bacterium]